MRVSKVLLLTVAVMIATTALSQAQTSEPGPGAEGVGTVTSSRTTATPTASTTSPRPGTTTIRSLSSSAATSTART